MVHPRLLGTSNGPVRVLCTIAQACRGADRSAGGSGRATPQRRHSRLSERRRRKRYGHEGADFCDRADQRGCLCDTRRPGGSGSGNRDGGAEHTSGSVCVRRTPVVLSHHRGCRGARVRKGRESPSASHEGGSRDGMRFDASDQRGRCGTVDMTKSGMASGGLIRLLTRS